MGVPEIGWSTDTGQASWIGPRLSRFGDGRASSVVPSGFAACARLLHPAETSQRDGTRAVRWAEVADWSGVPLARQAQFVEIALPEHVPAGAAPWEASPREGTLTGEDAAALVELLEQHTATAGRCWFGVWDGYGWGSGVTYSRLADTAATEQPDPAGEVPQRLPDRLSDPVPEWVRAGPRVRLPSRDYLLYAGHVSEALALVDGKQQTPNLWWPADRSWCVASEIDLPWTYLAGSVELVEAVLADPRLEALPAELADAVHTRVPEWVAGAVELAVDELLEHGTATVRTSWGTVRAGLRRPTWRKSGWLDVRSEGVTGSGGGSSGPVRRKSAEQLRSRVAFRLAGAILEFVDR